MGQAHTVVRRPMLYTLVQGPLKAYGETCNRLRWRSGGACQRHARSSRELINVHAHARALQPS